jgi:hypothetical protein
MMNDKFDMNVMDEVGVEEVYLEEYGEWSGFDKEWKRCERFMEMRDIMMEVNEELDKE